MMSMSQARDSFSPSSVTRAPSVQMSQHDAAMMQQQMYQQQMQRAALEQQIMEQQMLQAPLDYDIVNFFENCKTAT